jgi:hypothetical protein
LTFLDLLRNHDPGCWLLRANRPMVDVDF